jgi:hypothetical protein
MKNINDGSEMVLHNQGPSLAIAVSGSETDRAYWQHRFALARSDVFRSDGNVEVVSTLEKTKKGSFLGVFNAWKDATAAIQAQNGYVPDISVMSLVFGKGTRFSPFTQTEGNRKSAFWTPMKSMHGIYLDTADISNMSVNIWVKHLREGGFRGVVVKWGDELIIPGVVWQAQDLRNVDALRCVGKIEVSDSIAREKDWVVVDRNSGLMRYQFARQGLASLQERLSSLPGDSNELRINLGSVILSYDFLDAALEIFQEDITNSKRLADWDPYVWMALCCDDESQWRAEAEIERGMGRQGIATLEANYPDFFAKVLMLRRAIEERTGHALNIATLEFGDSFWIDLGLHLPLRTSLASLLTDTERGRTNRYLFNIPDERDEHGNIIIGSVVPPSAVIRNSVIIDSVIRDGASVIDEGRIIKSKHDYLMMPQGGSALFCAVNRMEYRGPNAVAYKSLGQEIILNEGDRHSTLLTPTGAVQMLSNESVIDYSGSNYTAPIMGNALSFEEAGALMGLQDGRQIEAQWQAYWDKL